MKIQEVLRIYLENHEIIGPIAFVLIRACAIVIAPIQGFVIDIVGILVFGWKAAFVFAEAGIMLGAMTAFFIARKFREPLLARFGSLQNIQKWEARLSERDSFFALLLLRIPTNPVFDYISYAAGLTSCRPLVFALSTFLGSLPSVFLFFYLGGVGLNHGSLYFIGALASFGIAGWIIWRKVHSKLGP